jgi:hypothetical protein
VSVSKRVLVIFIGILFTFGISHWGSVSVAAQIASEPTPKRQTTIVVSYTEYEWWLIRWDSNEVVCRIITDHEGVPLEKEIAGACGETVYAEWKVTPPCKSAEKGGQAAASCPGMYVFLAGGRSGERTLVVDLPPPTVLLNLSNCHLAPPENLCTEIPTLLITGEEPLPNESITAIHVLLGDKAYDCAGSSCEIPLSPTLKEGLEIIFWADSSFGDASEQFRGLVRVLESGVLPGPGGSGWYVNVLSSQWRGGPTESCAQEWQAFPPVGRPPFWLSTPSREELLASDKPYHYLAGRLIDQGLVDATDCPGDGLLDNGYANACGLDRARSMVELWQNQFDPRIVEVANEMGLPAQLMKNLFAQESQFWPGIFRVAREYGLGQMTDMGADTLLLWNSSFFEQFCPLVLDASVCGRGYLRLKDSERAILRGALAVQMNADCADCQSGIDLTHADYSVLLFAQTLKANCGQVSQTIYNATKSVAGAVSSYEDLWRFTLANYHAGPGCLSFAIHAAWSAQDPLDWEHVSENLTEACRGVIGYVDLITR